MRTNQRPLGGGANKEIGETNWINSHPDLEDDVICIYIGDIDTYETYYTSDTDNADEALESFCKTYDCNDAVGQIDLIVEKWVDGKIVESKKFQRWMSDDGLLAQDKSR